MEEHADGADFPRTMCPPPTQALPKGGGGAPTPTREPAAARAQAWAAARLPTNQNPQIAKSTAARASML